MPDIRRGDSFDLDYEVDERALRRARSQQLDEAFAFLEQPPPQPAAQPAAGQRPAKEPAAPEQEGPGALEDIIVRGIVGGLRDAGVSTLEGLEAISRFTPQGAIAARFQEALGTTPPRAGEVIPDVPDPETGAGGITKGLTQFLSLFVPIAGQARAAGITGGALRRVIGAQPGAAGRTLGFATEGAGVGAVADFFAFDPQEARLSNLLQDFGVESDVVDALAAEPDDGEFEGRLKNVTEGLIAGGVAGPVVGWLGRSVTAMRRSRVVRNADEIADLPQGVVEDVESAGALVREARENLGQLRALQDAVAQRGDTAQEALDALAGMDPAAAERAVRFTSADLPQLVRDAEESLGLAEERWAETLRTAEVPESTLAQFKAIVDDATPPELADELAPAREATDAILAGPRPGLVGAEGVERGLQAEDPAALEAALSPAIRTADGTIHTGGPTHAHIAMRSPELTDEALDAAETGFVRDGEFMTREQATELARAELGQVPRAEPEAPREIVANRLEMTAEQARALRQAAETGDFELAANGLREVFDSTNFARIADEDGVKDLLVGLAETFGRRAGTARVTDRRSLVETQLRATRMIARDAQDFEVPEGQVVKAINELVPATVDLDVKVNAIRTLEMGLASKVHSLAVRGAGGQWSLAEEADFVRYATLLANVNDARAGIVSQLGRALGSLRTIASGAESNVQGMRELVTRMGGGREQLQAVAQRLVASSGNRKATRNILRKSMTRRGLIGRMFTEHFLNSILSSPVTMTVNALSNTAVGLYLPAENLLSAAVGLNTREMRGALRMYRGMFEGLKAAMLGTAHGRRVSMQAFGKLMMGQAGAAKALVADTEGVPTAIRALATGDTIHAPNVQFDLPGPGAISTEAILDTVGAKSRIARAFNHPAGKWLAHTVDAFGVATRLPTRTLTAFDEIAKAANYHAKLHQLAFDDAARRNLTGIEADDHMRRLVEHASSADDPALDAGFREQLGELDQLARDYASYATFTNDLPIGSFSRSIQEMTLRHPWMRVIVPFVRTPVNLLRFGLVERGPAAVFSRPVIEGLLRGDRATMTRLTIGLSFGAYAAQMAMEGRLTGNGPVDPARREGLQQSGWRPRSIRTENPDGSETYTEISRFDPISSVMIAAADIAEMSGQWDESTRNERVGMFVALLTQNLTSKSYFQGLQDAMLAMHNPQHYGTRFLTRTAAAAAVPASNLFAQMRRVNDPTIPQADKRDIGLEFASRLVDRLPNGADDALRDFLNTLEEDRRKLEEAPKLNIWGETVEYPMGVGLDIVSPFFQSESQPSEVRQAIADLRIPLDMRSLYGSIAAGEGRPIKLSPTQVNRYIELTANPPGAPPLEQALEKLMASRQWDQLSAEDFVDEQTGRVLSGQAKAVKDVINRYRQAARARLLQEDPELGLLAQEQRAAAQLSRSQRGLQTLNDLARQRAGEPTGNPQATRLLEALGGSR